MSRDAIEATLRALYEARRGGDVERMLGLFAPDATYCMVGDSAASPVVGVHGGEALRDAMTALSVSFMAEEMRLSHVVIDGDRAAVEVEARLVFGPTGEVFETRWASLVTLRDGRIAEVREFIDTARAAQLFAGLPKAEPA